MREIANARLHDRGARDGIDGEDALELGEREHDARGVGQRAARQTGARASRDDGHARRVAYLQDRDDLRLVLRESHRGRLRAIQRQAIALVRLGLLGRDEQRGGREDRRQLGLHGGVKHGSIIS